VSELNCAFPDPLLNSTRSALLNPHRDAFCLGGSTNQINLPIQINQTTPILIELLRIDFDSADTETISISAKSLRNMKKAALKTQHPKDPNSPLILQHPVKKPGLYTLQKIVDESNLQVRPRQSNVVVVQCPQARVLRTSPNKCRGELSDIAFEVIGTPPLRVKYRKMVNDNPVEASFQSIQPEDFISPLSRQQQLAGTVMRLGDTDASWARAQRVVVPVNETLFNSGRWWYAIDEVHDALGNMLSYVPQLDDYERPRTKITDQQQLFTVHERPRLSLRGHSERGCDSQHPLKVARGDKQQLPVKFESEGRGPIEDEAHTVEYLFTATQDILSNGDHNPEREEIRKHVFKNNLDSLLIGESGLYSLTSVATQFCAGEVMEPASCLLQNPPQPEVSISYTNITDRCAGNPVGLSVTLDFTGTPPFEVHYLTRKKGSKGDQYKTIRADGLRAQIELTPPDAGEYTYEFSDINDRYYKGMKMSMPHIEQTVKPSASAHFESASPSGPLCLYEEAAFNVRLGGEGPWNLEYELVHNGKRSKKIISDIVDEHVTLKTGALDSGGEYTISLTSIEAGGCKEYSKEEVSFTVRHQRPKAAFGLLDGKRNVHTLEGKQLRLPLRLTGERPWTLEYQNTDDTSAPIVRHTAYNENFMLEVNQRGTYQLKNVRDSACPGVVDEDADQFKVEWIERPTLSIAGSPTVEVSGSKFVKKEVCEGDEDFVELAFTGTLCFSFLFSPSAILINTQETHLST
jgi:nucleoporin POM152